jgi:hypothetical protein
MNKVQYLQGEISHLRAQLQQHVLYKNLESIDDIKLFMEHHVFAVWDFMSLLKALQIHLTCVKTPWIPMKSSVLARFINEIVHGEESDLDDLGQPKSHFEMYRDAMMQINASTLQIDNFIASIKAGQSVGYALHNIAIHEAVSNFVTFTFKVISSQQPHLIASAFTFGREDVIPDMFIEILKNSGTSASKNNKLVYYFERHIELDGDAHGPLSLLMISELCESDTNKWDEAIDVAKQALEQRLKLWDAINSVILQKKALKSEYVK